MDEELKERFLEFLTDLINDFDWLDIDGFNEYEQLNDEQISELIHYCSTLKVTEKEEDDE